MRTCLRHGVALLLILPAFAGAQVSVVGDLSQDKIAFAGTSYTGVITVRNESDEPQEAKVYQTDYSFHFSGSNSYGEPGILPRSNANWISVNPTFLTLSPRSIATVNYSVTIPQDSLAPLTGTYWSMIMIEGIAPGSPESRIPQKDRQEVGLAQTIRYGIQVATTIAETGTPNVRFLNAELQRRENGDPVLQVDIENTGDILMRPEVYVEIFDENGLTQGNFPAPTFRIYPGTSVREIMVLSGIPPGTYKALVAVDNGTDDIFAAEFTLEL